MCRTGEKPYACSHKGCGRRFARISDQRSHERIHSSDAKKYECRHCGKRFTRPYDLKKHELNIHRQELSVIGKRKESGAGTSAFSGGGTRMGGSKRARVTGVEISGTIPGENRGAGAERSLQPLQMVASAAADGMFSPAAVEQQQQQQQQQQLQEQAGHSGQSSLPLPIVASAAASTLVATAQQQQPQEQTALSSQPPPTTVTAADSGLVPTVQQQQVQEKHNELWRQQYEIWQSKQQVLNNHRQPKPEKSGSVAGSSRSTAGQGYQLLPLPLPQPTPQGPALAKTPVAPPPKPKPAAEPHKHLRRKRVRCDAHKHIDPAAAPERVGSQGAANVVNVPPRGSATGGVSTAQHGDDRPQEQKIADAFAEAKAHVHGAACGHVAVLHENHVDFLMEGGQLECFDGKEVRLLRSVSCRAVLCCAVLCCGQWGLS